MKKSLIFVGLLACGLLGLVGCSDDYDSSSSADAELYSVCPDSKLTYCPSYGCCAADCAKSCGGWFTSSPCNC